MAMRYREIDALLRWAESNDNMTAAIKSGKAGKELRREREAVVEAAGGKEKLDRADLLLADAETVHAKANAYMAEKQAEARDAERKRRWRSAGSRPALANANRNSRAVLPMPMQATAA